MRTFKLYSLATLLIGLTFWSAEANAQELVTGEGDITGSAGLSLGSNIGVLGSSEPGLTIQGYYGITDEIRAGGSFTYYLVSQEGLSASEFNIDGHYLFRNEDNIVLYGLGGISFANVSVDTGWGNVGGGSTGLNLGGGIEYHMGSFLLFGEPKVTVAGWGQFQVTAGARLRF